MTARPPWGVAKRRRWAIRLLVRALVAPSTVADDERAAVGAWLSSVARGGELKRFDLRTELDKRGYSVRTFAKKLGVSWRLVYYWTTHERKPSYEMAGRIAAALGIPAARVVARTVIQHRTARKLPPYDESLPLLGRNLAAARALCKLTAAQLSAITGVSTADILACESPYKTPPSGLPIILIQRAIANRLRRRGYRTATKIDRTRRKKKEDA